MTIGDKIWIIVKAALVFGGSAVLLYRWLS